MNNDAKREFFSQKMAWLSEKCRDPQITDAQFRYLYALIVDYLSNDPDDPWCGPKDEVLGRAVGGKCSRSLRYMAAELKAGEHITKRKRPGSSLYFFPGLTEDRQNETRPATSCRETGNTLPEDRQHACRTEPSGITLRVKPFVLASELYNSGDTLENPLASKKAFNKEAISSDHPGKLIPKVVTVDQFEDLLKTMDGGRRRQRRLNGQRD